MKTVMLSVRPKWCGLIASGKKTIEIRKSAPKGGAPFKCLIYMTKCKERDAQITDILTGQRLDGKVIGEFICDRIDEIYCDRLDNGVDYTPHYYTNEGENEFMAQCCVSEFDLERYLGYKGTAYLVGYGWHISDLKMYDEPLSITEFRPLCKTDELEVCCGCKNACADEDGVFFDCAIKRPPQSWRYIRSDWR